MQKLFDPIRNRFVEPLPEEIVRQRVIKNMLQMGYRKNQIAVEKKLSTLPHLIGKPTSGIRRADILYFAKGIHPEYDLFPLLMIECKATSINQHTFAQIIGYNQYVQAKFLAVVNQETLFTLYYDREKKEYEKIDYLPSCDQLLDALRRKE